LFLHDFFHAPCTALSSFSVYREPCTVNRFFLITIDVEDWFQVENFKPWIPFSTWDSRDLRVERNVHQLLDLFDSFALSPCTVHHAPFIHATFFILGWIAERLPRLVREIAARGHEVASHGSSHRMCGPLSNAELRDELAGSKRLLEDITGAEVAGFRAPNFSVDDRVLGLIREVGYQYDSSYNSFSLHGRYGKITLNGQPRAGIAYELNDDFFELPVSNLNLGSFIGSRFTVHGSRQNSRFILPWGGGAYFRLLPFGVFRRGVRSILDRDGAYIFYLHPWEIDPEQPRVGQASRTANFKHSANLEKTPARLRRMMEAFADCRFVSCTEYLKEGAPFKGSGAPEVEKDNPTG
jgi:polysaccharide deacetylase family protein (PEP-CTERM system associated)